ncbi:MAG: pirin family protein [Nocardioidaceae bacterium]
MITRSGDRFVTRTEWLESRHAFSYGPHYDPTRTHFGLLLVSNDDVVAPGTGFDPHQHRDTEIVTWVLDGSLVHEDSTGDRGVIHPGLAQRMSAGTGIVHSERNDAWRLDGDEPADPVRYVQMWVVPDAPDGVPGYQQADVADLLDSGSWVTVASGLARHRDQTAVTIAQRHAALQVVRLQPGASAQLPAAPYVHVFLARGAVDLEGAGALRDGDAALLTAADGQRITATAPAEALVWEMHVTTG